MTPSSLNNAYTLVHIFGFCFVATNTTTTIFNSYKMHAFVGRVHETQRSGKATLLGVVVNRHEEEGQGAVGGVLTGGQYKANVMAGVTGRSVPVIFGDMKDVGAASKNIAPRKVCDYMRNIYEGDEHYRVATQAETDETVDAHAASGSDKLIDAHAGNYDFGIGAAAHVDPTAAQKLKKGMHA